MRLQQQLKHAVHRRGAILFRPGIDGVRVFVKPTDYKAQTQRVWHTAAHPSRIEVEVASLGELEEAIDAAADVIMLDNFVLEDVRQAAKRVSGLGTRRPLLEVSGGVKLDQVAELARAGVDVISVGALTHSAPSADIALGLAL